MYSCIFSSEKTPSRARSSTASLMSVAYRRVRSSRPSSSSTIAREYTSSPVEQPAIQMRENGYVLSSGTTFLRNAV